MIATFRAKPPAGAQGVLRSSPAAAGLRGLWPLAAGAGGIVFDSSGNGYHGTIVGAPTWSVGPFGAQLGNFSTSNYVTIDPPAQIMALTYPCWMAAVVNVPVSSAGAKVFFGQGHSTGTNGTTLLQVSTGTFQFQLKNDAGTARTLSSPITTYNDGLWHLVMGVANGNSSESLYVDGALVATGASAIGTLTSDRLTIGAMRTSAVGSPFTSGTIALAAAGNGAVPDPMAMYIDPWAALRSMSVGRSYMMAPRTAGAKSRRNFTRRVGSRGAF